MQQDINSDLFPLEEDIQYKVILQQLEDQIVSLSPEEQAETRESILKQIDARRTDDAYTKIKERGTWTCSVCNKEQHVHVSSPNFAWLKEEPSQEIVICNECHGNLTRDNRIEKGVKCIDGRLKMY